MKNMFTGHSQKKVPKTLNDCIKPDGVSSNLWIWAERLEKWGSVLFGLIIIFGIINMISTGVTTYQEIDILGDEDAATLATVFAVLTSLFTYALYAFLEYCAYHAIALLIGALASIVQNTNVSANLALYSIKGKSGDKFTEESKPKESKNRSHQPPKYTVQNEEDNNSDYRIDINSLNTPSDDNDVGEIVEENYIDIKCPHCGEELSFPESTQNATCPWCNNSFEVKQYITKDTL